MSEALHMDVPNPIAAADPAASSPMPRTTLASDLSTIPTLAPIAGRLTPSSFSSLAQELEALLKICGLYDLGWKAHISVGGEDRLRWLNGMVTNAVQQLADGDGNYSFLLNAQGRIQGDAYLFREAEQLLLETEADQVEKLLAHLDRFIIMDDVTLTALANIGAIGLSGPNSAELLARLGVVVPELAPNTGAAFRRANLCGIPIHVATIAGPKPAAVRYELWSSPDSLATLWHHLLSVGAVPCGIEAIEALRILEGIPRYGVDLVDRDLPQETSQVRALNFNKGCYLGQEIVERIRSRGAVHRGLRQFRLSAMPSQLPADLRVGDAIIGRITSAAAFPDGNIYALGIVRTEAMTRGTALTYNEGTAVAHDRPPTL